MNTHRKTRPKGRIFRVHILMIRKTAKISCEHMQRTNAKDNAVEGGEVRLRPWASSRQASSQPIAPAVAGQPLPQPAGKSIAYSAADWCRGINVRLFECSDCSISSSGTEEVVERHFGLNNAGMRVAQETRRRHQCQMNRRPRSRQLLEGPGFQRGKQHSLRRYSSISISTRGAFHPPPAANTPRPNWH